VSVAATTIGAIALGTSSRNMIRRLDERSDRGDRELAFAQASDLRFDDAGDAHPRGGRDQQGRGHQARSVRARAPATKRSREHSTASTNDQHRADHAAITKPRRRRRDAGRHGDGQARSDRRRSRATLLVRRRIYDDAAATKGDGARNRHRVAMTIAMAAGILVGAFAGFYGGVVGAVLMRFGRCRAVLPAIFCCWRSRPSLSRTDDHNLLIAATRWMSVARGRRSAGPLAARTRVAIAAVAFGSSISADHVPRAGAQCNGADRVARRSTSATAICSNPMQLTWIRIQPRRELGKHAQHAQIYMTSAPGLRLRRALPLRWP